MSDVKSHYENVLSEVYSWMMGGIDSAVARNAAVFDKLNVSLTGSGVAVDLGCGCGFQSIPLSERGFSVVAIDTDMQLLEELKAHYSSENIQTINDDLLEFDKYISEKPELVVCFTDTILHLESKKRVETLFKKTASALVSGGKFILTFRDLTFELKDCERFLPVKSDDDRIMTCFLEYEPETVKVYDLVYSRTGDSWCLNKSFYRKLRLAKNWIEDRLSDSGFSDVKSTVENGLITVVAVK